MQTLRVYSDTSVFGGCFDAEFQEASESFFQLVREGRFVLIVSDLVNLELERAPERVRELLRSLTADQVERVETTAECKALRQAYLDAGVVHPSSALDALHIAIATVNQADIVVSWNFKHIVQFRRIAGFEGVNSLRGYRSPRIYSPKEVIEP
jgi:hypothetical protein